MLKRMSWAEACLDEGNNLREHGRLTVEAAQAIESGSEREVARGDVEGGSIDAPLVREARQEDVYLREGAEAYNDATTDECLRHTPAYDQRCRRVSGMTLR